jgi:hypothetical protein
MALMVKNDNHAQRPFENVVYKMSYSQIVFGCVNAEHRFPSFIADYIGEESKTDPARQGTANYYWKTNGWRVQC